MIEPIIHNHEIDSESNTHINGPKRIAFILLMEGRATSVRQFEIILFNDKNTRSL